MKILLLSDSHGIDGTFYEAYDREKPDKVFFAGDGISGMLEFRDCYADPSVETYMVCGNCDFDHFGEFEFSQTINVKGRRVFLTHGHREHVKSGLSYLVAEAKLRGCDVAVFGHTHVQADISKDGVRTVNPGAAASGRYGLITIDDSGIEVSLKKI